jgi:broad specificity phosphatase PhoE
MHESLPVVYLARHGETAWSLSGQHTGLTDLPLTAAGEDDARSLGERLRKLVAARVFTSPLQRAQHTCDLIALCVPAQVDPDLVEWNYGDYEGLRTAEIHVDRPGWNIFRDGCPGGESPEDVMARAHRVIRRLRSDTGNVIVFSSGHFLRVLASGWIGLDVRAGGLLILSTASLSALGYERNQHEPVIRLWNDTAHLAK